MAFDLGQAREIDITVTGRRSGREITNPVWFAHEGDTLYLLPVYGSDTQWYRNPLKSPTIRVAANGTELTAQAAPITDAARVQDVEQKFRAKYGDANAERYYPKRDVAVEVSVAS
jgi:deazaflavin-dependent oxidoreductase (nitroreductase family)